MSDEKCWVSVVFAVVLNKERDEEVRLRVGAEV